MRAAIATPRKVRKLDRYEIIAQLAKGGMATVYLARLRGAGGFERLLAIKMMHPHLAEETQFVNMFLDEARLAAKLHHPNAVAITDVCTTEAGHYLVMEYVDGFTLSNLFKAKGVEPERRIRLALRILLDAATGLDAAHKLTDHKGKGLEIVHRDVSPQNIMVSCNGVGRITDFGIAHAATRITASQPGTLKGKFNYMSPEQALGAAVDCRADVFCLGIILWELLVGRKLFHDAAGGAATLTRVVTADIEKPSEAANEVISTEFDAVCLKALRKKKTDRYSSAREFVTELEKATVAAGMLATTTELSDAINEIFEDRIKARRRAIADFLMGDELDVSLISTSDLVSLPVIPHSGDDGSDPGAAHTPSRITPREPATDSDFPTIPADSLTPKPVEITGKPSRSRLLLGAGGVAVLLAVALGLGFSFAGSDEPAAERVTEPDRAQDFAAPPTEAPTEVVAPPTDEPELAASDEGSSTEADAGAVAVADEPSTEEAVAEPPPAGRDTRSRGRRGHSRRGHSRRGSSGQRGGTSSSSSGSQGSSSTQPQPVPAETGLDWEDNPYLRR